MRPSRCARGSSWRRRRGSSMWLPAGRSTSRRRCSIAPRPRSGWRARASRASGIRTGRRSPRTSDTTRAPRSHSTWRCRPNQAYTQPYWLVKPPTADVYRVDDQMLIGLPDTPAAARVRVRLTVDGAPIELVRPVHHRYADRAQGERVRPFVVVPAVAVNLPEPVALFPDAAARKVQVSVQANVADAQGDLRLEVPAGWKAEPSSREFRDRRLRRAARGDVRGDAASGRNHGQPARRRQGERARYRVGDSGDLVSAFPAADPVPAVGYQAGARQHQGDGARRSGTSWARATRCRTRCGNSGSTSRCSARAIWSRAT